LGVLVENLGIESLPPELTKSFRMVNLAFDLDHMESPSRPVAFRGSFACAAIRK
jgi:hypothetical protein